MLDSFLYMQRDLEQDNGHFLVLVQRKSGILSVQIVHKVNGTELQRIWWPGRCGPQGMSSTGGGGLARVPNLRVCDHLLCRVAHAGREGRINILPWWQYLQWVAKEGEPGCPKKVSGRQRGRQSSPIPAQASRGENGQYSGAGLQLTLDKTVGSRVWWHTQGFSKLRLDLGWGSGQPGSGVAIDWVTSRSYSSATKAKRRLDVQSGLRKARYMVKPCPDERSRPWSWALKRCRGKRMGPWFLDNGTGGEVVAAGCASNGRVSRWGARRS